ncbi:MAG: CAP domain-containing protein [Halothece sp.]
MSVEPTPYEQYFLELVNRARLNPSEEARLYETDLNEGLTGEEKISAESKQPLTFNPVLLDVARGHSEWMIENNEFGHEGANGTTAIERAESAGYPSSYVGENIAWRGSNQEIKNIVGLIDKLHKELVTSSSHRTNLFKENYQEIGIGLYSGKYTRNGEDWNAVMVSHKYGSANLDNNNFFITGVAYEDLNNNDFYDPGEGLPNITIEVTSPNGDFSATTTTMSAGGYQIEVPSGEYEVEFTGNQLETTVTEKITVNDHNVKVDVTVDGGSNQILAEQISFNHNSTNMQSPLSQVSTVTGTNSVTVASAREADILLNSLNWGSFCWVVLAMLILGAISKSVSWAKANYFR